MLMERLTIKHSMKFKTTKELVKTHKKYSKP